MDVLYPKKIDSLNDEFIVQIRCGELHSASLSKDGVLYTWGLGSDGRLGHGNTLTYDKPTVVSYFNGKISFFIYYYNNLIYLYN